MLCVGVIQVSVYYLFSATVRPDGMLAVAQPDTSLYLQAARRIVEGAAFSYSKGEISCTGTTSVLYPFVLALPYALGAKGGSFLFAGFALNACFYLLFLLGWARVIDAKVRVPAAKAASALLLATFGQFAYVSLAQSDIGFWLAVSALFAWGLACDRPWLWRPMLLVGPWVRPEGMVCVIAFAMVAIVVRRDRKFAALALVSMGGVFVLNHFLTGSWQFTSVQNKGHFATEPFALAVVSSFKDAVTMLRQLFLGLSSGGFREMFFFPVLGAACLWHHVLRRDYSDFDSREALFLLAAVGGFATVAMSGWQGTNFDRYLAWVMPVAVVWTACGAVELGERLKGVARFLPVTLLLVFGVVGSIAAAFWFRIGCERTEVAREFFSRCEETLPADASLGGFGNSSCAYWLSARRYAHLYGIYSPEFVSKHLVAAMEVLKHKPELRFDYWLYDAAIEGDLVPEASRAAFGDAVLLGPLGLELRKADWRPFDEAAEVPAPPREGLRCKARVDVGCEEDERGADYQAFGTYLQHAPDPFFRLDMLGGRKVAEVGRIVTGGDEMTVSALDPEKDLFVVMRTVRRQSAAIGSSSGGRPQEYAFAAAQTLRALVDGQDAGGVQYEVPENGFADVSFRIPASALTSSFVRLTLQGDHISCGYWFYQ